MTNMSAPRLRGLGLFAAAFSAYLLDPRSGLQRRRKLASGLRRVRATVSTLASTFAADRPAVPPTDVTSLEDLCRRFEQRGVELVEHQLNAAGDIVCGRCATPSAPEAMSREWRHRLEGPSDPSAAGTVSGLRCGYCEALGILTLPYGPQADETQADVLLRLPVPDTDSIEDALAAYPTITERVSSLLRSFSERLADRQPPAVSSAESESTGDNSAAPYGESRNTPSTTAVPSVPVSS